jgi:hypothetical protein
MSCPQHLSVGRGYQLHSPEEKTEAQSSDGGPDIIRKRQNPNQTQLINLTPACSNTAVEPML